MNWRCDVYVYEHVGGYWATHVASRRRVMPPIPDIPFSWLPRFGAKLERGARKVEYPTAWHKRAAHFVYRIADLWHRLHMGCLDLIPLRPIGLPHDGEFFDDSTPAECAERLRYLREVGYIVPQYAIDALEAEAADMERV